MFLQAFSSWRKRVHRPGEELGLTLALTAQVGQVMMIGLMKGLALVRALRPGVEEQRAEAAVMRVLAVDEGLRREGEGSKRDSGLKPMSRRLVARRGEGARDDGRGGEELMNQG